MNFLIGFTNCFEVMHVTAHIRLMESYWRMRLSSTVMMRDRVNVIYCTALRREVYFRYSPPGNVNSQLERSISIISMNHP